MTTRTVTLQPHQERVVAEKAELDAKIEKLDAFSAWRYLSHAVGCRERSPDATVRTHEGLLQRPW